MLWFEECEWDNKRLWYYGKLKFEGEYLYDKKTKGREYYSNGKLEYEGEYFFDNKYDGKGYDENGSIIWIN